MSKLMSTSFGIRIPGMARSGHCHHFALEDYSRLSSPDRRRADFLRGIDPCSMRGLEVGPLNRPTVTRDIGPMFYADFAPTPVLREAYRDCPSVPVEEIAEVDFVWSDGLQLREVTAGMAFDYVLASHVIEHIPNVVSWLEQIAGCLEPGGLLSLIVPDKRFTFDRLRPLTTMGEVIDAYIQGAEKPSPGQILEHLTLHARVDVEAAWSGAIDFPLVHTPDQACDMTVRAVQSGDYFDVHCWVFTPSSFLDLCDGLSKIGRFPFEIAAFSDSHRHEIDFFVTLAKLDASLPTADQLARQAGSIERARRQISRE